jgi:hypothetical protein
MDRLSPRDGRRIAIPASGRASRFGAAASAGSADGVDATPAHRRLVEGRRISPDAFRLLAKAPLRLDSRRVAIQEGA